MKYGTYCKAGAIFTLILGTALHFTYDLLGESDFAAIFSAVNESTWEHLKLLFFPAVIFSLIEYFIYGKELSNFWAAKTISLLAGMFAIISAFYTYTGILGTNFAIVDILIFIASVVLTYYLYCLFIKTNAFSSPFLNKLSVITLVIIFIMFWVYTFYPPLINLFKDPITGGFGI